MLTQGLYGKASLRNLGCTGRITFLFKIAKEERGGKRVDIGYENQDRVFRVRRTIMIIYKSVEITWRNWQITGRAGAFQVLRPVFLRRRLKAI